MTQEEKQLLLKDFCVRLPYGVKYNFGSYEGCDYTMDRISLTAVDDAFPIEDVKPYLRPIKSMTPEECDKLFEILNIREDSDEWLKINDIGILRLFTENGKDFYEIAEAMDYLYSIHIDFRGLIELGLALEATEDMYKTE